MALNPSSQYADDRNLAARQRLWQDQQPPFDVVGWVLGLVPVSPGDRVLDLGCGNGSYLRAMAERGIYAAGCDLSVGMLRAAKHPIAVAADATSLPFPDATFDVVLAAQMLYHVADRRTAISELRRVVRQRGVCVAVTNGAGHIASLRAVVERAVHDTSSRWKMVDWAGQAFSLENGANQLASAFTDVRCVRPKRAGRVVIRDAAVVADYVASVADRYQAEVTKPWEEVIEEVRRRVQREIDRDGAFITTGDIGAFVCR